MSLEARKYKFEEGDSHDIFELELTPEMVDGVEVYSIEAVVSDSTGIVGKSEKLHYGYLSKEANIPVEFKNSDFNQYNAFEIDGALSVENSSFKNLRFISSLDNKESVQKIENSICRDVIRLHNISKLSFSEINNTDISNNKEVEVSNEFIKDQRIGNYEDFAKNSQTRANFDRDSRITEDLEVL